VNRKTTHVQGICSQEYDLIEITPKREKNEQLSILLFASRENLNFTDKCANLSPFCKEHSQL
jgi:hypothetical protein